MQGCAGQADLGRDERTDGHWESLARGVQEAFRIIPDFARRSRLGVRAAGLCQPTLFQPTSAFHERIESAPARPRDFCSVSRRLSPRRKAGSHAAARVQCYAERWWDGERGLELTVAKHENQVRLERRCRRCSESHGRERRKQDRHRRTLAIGGRTRRGCFIGS